MATARRCIALVGGGRWARVHASVLRSFFPRVDRLVWVSRHNRTAIEQIDRRAGAKVEFVATLDEALAFRPDAAVVCTTSANHAQDARAILELGIAVLVEKPLALDCAEAAAAIAVAERRGLPFFVCLPLVYASYLRRFKAACDPRKVGALEVSWFDIAAEARYGERKLIDLATHKVDELVPHLWSLMQLFIEPGDIRIDDTGIAEADTAVLRLVQGTTRVSARFGRRAAVRQRRVDLSFTDGGSASLDFTVEPGIGSIDGRELPDDGFWTRDLRPLASIHTSVLDALDDRSRAAENPLSAQKCLSCVALTDNVRRRIIAHEAERAAALLRGGHDVAGSPALMNLILDNIVPELARWGERIDASDDPALRRLASAAGLSACTRHPDTAAFASSAFVATLRRHLGDGTS